MSRYIKRSATWAVSIITFMFMFIPEDMFKQKIMIPMLSVEINVIINRTIIFGIVLIISFIANAIYQVARRSILINGKNYSIKISYGDIFKQKDCKIVIPFDECFTSTVGNEIADINPGSICGQYLMANNSINIQQLIATSNLKPKGKSKYDNKDRYESGRVLLQDRFLLLAFAKLDKVGKGILTRKEYIDSLSVLWEEIDNHYGQQDVCIPILGSGTTRIGDNELTQQELLDIIINSYKLSVHKIKKPYKLRIVCKRTADFLINDIETI